MCTDFFPATFQHKRTVHGAFRNRPCLHPGCNVIVSAKSPSCLAEHRRSHLALCKRRIRCSSCYTMLSSYRQLSRHRMRGCSSTRRMGRLNVGTLLQQLVTPPSTIGHGIAIRTSMIKGAGRGLFSERSFVAGEVITYYDGDLIYTRRCTAYKSNSRTHFRAVRGTVSWYENYIYCY